MESSTLAWNLRPYLPYLPHPPNTPHRYIHSHTCRGRNLTSPREDMNESARKDVRVDTNPKRVNGFGDAIAMSAVSPFPFPIRSSPTSSRLMSSMIIIIVLFPPVICNSWYH